MSQLLIHQYLNQLAALKMVSGSVRESVVREAFKDLLKGHGRAHDLIFVPEYEIESPAKERRYVDGALLYSLRVPFGYWEAKDETDDLNAEIEVKLRRGYSQDNIVFEDSRQAVLIQNRHEVARCAVDDTDALERLLRLFFAYQRPEITDFRKAVMQFKADLPAILGALREMIEHATTVNAVFREAEEHFLAHARNVINPSLTAAVREMLIQHVLTEELFTAAGLAPKLILKMEQETGRIVLDSETTLIGVPSNAWDYRLGNRCPLEWILDQHKEKKPKDPTIRAKFDTYRFADDKEKVIDLLLRVTTVSVETMIIVTAMAHIARE